MKNLTGGKTRFAQANGIRMNYELSGKQDGSVVMFR
jgi:hypothetical protein